MTGAPLEDAVFRTNHGFGSTTVAHYMWNDTDALENSDQRYHVLSDAIAGYALRGSLMDGLEAVNVTALLGQKGGDLFHCTRPFNGSNVLSVAFKPLSSLAWAAWEDGKGDSWTPAACNTYIALNLSLWF